MELIKIDKNNINIPLDIIAALGEFDGFHLGHIKLLDRTITECKKHNKKSGVITFDPHPDYVLNKRDNCGYITPMEEKIKFVEKTGIEYFIIIHFDKEVSQLSEKDFYIKYLKNLYGVVVGTDYHYGFKGQGNINTLMNEEINVFVEEEVKYNKTKIGSNAIREFIKSGQVDKIKHLLGRNYSLQGIVCSGSHIGKTIGFSTANIELKDEYQNIMSGVYAVFVRVKNNKYLGVANVGNNPSINYVKNKRLEVHILDFNDDIYNECIEIEFISRLRDEVKFESKDELIKQIKNDINKVRESIK